MSLPRLCALNVINLISFLRLGPIVPVFLGPGALNVRNVHLISHELRRSDGPNVHLRDGVGRVKGVRRKSVGCESDTLR